MGKQYIGINIDDFYIKTGLLNKQGKIIKTYKIYAEINKGKQKILENLIYSIKELWNKDIEGIGISIPGIVDNQQGKIIESQSLNLYNLNLKKILSKEFKTNIYLDNNANCLLLAEQKFGSLKNTKDGSALIINGNLYLAFSIDGKLVRGKNNCAGELGKIPFRGITIADYASSIALKRISKYQGKSMSEQKLIEMAKSKKGFAKQIFNEYGNNLGIVLSIIVNMLNTENMIIAGSLSQAYPYYKQNMVTTLKKHTAKNANLKISQTKLKNEGILGAFCLIK